MRSIWLTAAVATALPIPHAMAQERTPEQHILDEVGKRGFETAAGQMTPPSRAMLALTVTAVGCHWRYTYAVPTGTVRFDPAEKPCTTSICRMGLDPDRAVAFPVGEEVPVGVTSDDQPRVLAVPQLGLQVEATAGRVNEILLQTKLEGVFAARQGADCLGKPDAIPAAFRVMDRRSFDDWVASRRGK